MTTEELQRAIKQQIECSDITASNVNVAVQNYIKCFSKHKQKLDKLVRVYPFLIKKLPLKPKSGKYHLLLRREGVSVCMSVSVSDVCEREGRWLTTLLIQHVHIVCVSAHVSLYEDVCVGAQSV